MQLIKAFFKQYPRQCLVVWVCLIVASVAEGLSLSSLLPLLSIATGNQSGLVDKKTSDFLSATLHHLSISPTVSAMLTIVVIGLFVKAGLTLAAYRQVGFTVARIATDMRLSFLHALSDSRWEYFLRQRTGHLANAISMEASNSAGAFQSVANLALLISQGLVFLIVALLINWKIACLAIVVAVLVAALLKIMVSISREAGGRQQNLYRSLMALLTDSLASLKPLKSMAREGEMDNLLARQTRELNATMRVQVLASEVLKSSQELLIGLVLVGGVGVSLLVWKLQLPEIMVLTIVLSRLLTRLSKLQQEYQKLVSKEAFYWSMQDGIQEARDAHELPFGRRQPTLEQGIQLQGLCFAYNDHQVLHDVDINIPAGQFTSLIGFSGAGKTTLVDLLIGLLRATGGQVLIDGVSLDDIDIRSWRSMIGYVPQENVLLHDSVYNNVVVGDQALGEARAVKALQQSGAWDFVKNLPEGIHTNVGEHGARFSGGQRQRIVIARALVHQPRLLILDEATSALDPETEKAVSVTLAALGSEFTLLAISHRGALTERADRVYSIEAGRAKRVVHPKRASA